MVKSATNYENLYIDGQWTGAAETLKLTDLAEGGTFASVAAATPADAETAMRETTVVHARTGC